VIVAPRSETEHAVAALWTELGLRPTTIDDQFLSVGGDVLRAKQLVARISARWGVDLAPEDFKAASSIAGLAATIDRKQAEARTSQSNLLQEALDGLDAIGDRFPG
jgi:enterobactin synthetase component F